MKILWASAPSDAGNVEAFFAARRATGETDAGGLGVLGGTFDPPHLGHLVIAEAARTALELQKVLFVPAKLQPHKLGCRVTPPAVRWNMLLRAIHGNDAFDACDLEVRRSGPSYTACTVTELRRRHPESRLFFICGSDALMEMASWYEPQTILANSVVAVADRPGTGPQVQVREAAAELTGRFGGIVLGFPAPAVPISSTLIREMLARGDSIRYLVPEKVFGFIRKRRLYTGGIGGIDQE